MKESILIAGFIARALVPGRDPMGIGGTILLGIVGSFVGGFLGWAIFGKDKRACGAPASPFRAAGFVI